MLFLSKIVKKDLLVLELLETCWEVFWDEKIDHFQNENQCVAFWVDLHRDFSLVHFLLVHDEVSSMLVNDLQKHDYNGSDFHEEFWLNMLLYFCKEPCKDLCNVLIFCVIFSLLKLGKNSVEQIRLWLLKVLEHNRPVSNVVLWDFLISFNGD